jgi:acylpyruvate hydrolase
MASTSMPKFAGSYFDAIGIGIDFTARDLQDKARDKRTPLGAGERI